MIVLFCCGVNIVREPKNPHKLLSKSFTITRIINQNFTNTIIADHNKSDRKLEFGSHFLLESFHAI
jgi:hypothetical protein